MQKYLFIDRDGTLIDEPQPSEQVDSYELLKFEPGVISALKSLAAAGFRLVIVTNQDGLGTPSLPEASFKGPNDLMLSIFGSEGVTFDEVLICPHFPHENCSCRKPKTGLVLDYLKPGVMDPENSYFIGDRESDVAMGQNMGIKSIRYDREANNWQKIAESILSKPRTAEIVRNTRETKITVSVDLDHPGKRDIHTGIGFFDHMLDQIASHGNFSLSLRCDGDLEVDEHHTVEDVGIALGEALKKALGDKRGIGRFGFALAMDEVAAKIEGLPEDSITNHEVACALDISGRPYAVFTCDAEFQREMVGGLPTEMVPHFFHSLACAMGLTLHLSVTSGNTHHQVEALFKGFGRALRPALRREGNDLPSTKGVL